MLKLKVAKSVKVALLGGLMGLAGVVEAKDVYYVSGYWGTPKDSATMVVKDGEGNTVTFPIADTDTLVVREGTAGGPTYGTAADSAYVSSEERYIPKNIRIERDFTFNAGVKTALFANSTIEIASGKVLVIQSTQWNNAYVGTVTFDGAGTAKLSGASQVASPIKVSASVTLQIPTNYAGEIAVTDPENLDMSKYPGYTKWVGEDGVAHLIKDGGIVAYVGERPFATFAEAVDAAKPNGTVRSVVNPWPTTGLPSDLTDAEKWQGTVQFSGTMPDGFAPANYGNAKSTIEFKGVSGGYLVNKGSFAGTLKVTNDGEKAGWTIANGYGTDNFVFGALIGEGTIVDVYPDVKQQYSFKDASKFGGSIKNAEAAAGKRFIIGKSVHGSDSAQTARIVVEEGYTVRVAEGQTLSGRWGMLVYGTIKGSGTLACTGSKMVYFGCGPNSEPKGEKATIDLSEGALTVDSSCGVTFGSTLTLKNVSAGDVILNCSSKPANLETVQLKNAEGTVMTLGSLKYADGKVTFVAEKNLHTQDVWTLQTAAEMAAVPNGYKLDLTDYLALDQAPIVLPVGTTTEEAAAFLAKLHVVPPTIRPNAMLAVKDNKLVISYEPMTLYWAAWRGTFWEHIGQTDANGNHGLMRDVAGNTIAHRPNDTVVFDKTHYTVGGEYLTTQYWHYDENLYIKNEVIPGDTNDWDLKILEGVTLKMGLRGARTTGQNVISKLKIYVEAGSTLELGYWGNTHHYQGVIREDVTFGGAGTITLGDDMGTSCRVEGDLMTAGEGTPTLDVRGKELVVQGGQIDVNLTGFGALSGSGTITTPITFNNATIDATNAEGFTFKNETTFTGTLTVDMTAAPTGEDLIKICTKGEGGSFVFTKGIDVIVRVGGEVQPAFYTLATDNDGNLCVKVAPVEITYDADVVLGYDYKTMICRVTMTPAIEGVIATVTVNNEGIADNLKTWTAPVIGMRGSGRCEVLVGDADDNFTPGTYSMTVSVGSWQQNLEFTLEEENDGNLAEVNGVGYQSMKEAVAAGGKITLLTNVFFAAPEGTYSIERNGFDIMSVNYTTIDPSTNEVTAENEVVFEREGEGAVKRVVIDGGWVAAALPWQTKKTINGAIWGRENVALAPFEAYLLGARADELNAFEIIARGVETGDPNTITIEDGLVLKDPSETGVVVTRKLIDAGTKNPISATNILNLSEVNKVKLLKLAYDFTADVGQEEQN